MYKVHVFYNDQKIIQQSMEHIPAKGDTMRFSDEEYGIVKEVIWCMDEEKCPFQRINIRTETEDELVSMGVWLCCDSKEAKNG